MEIKKKFLHFLKSFGVVSKVVLSVMLVLGLQMTLSTTCFASEPDYSDFDIPLEFWQSFFTYQNSIKSFGSDKINTFAQLAYDYYNNTFKSLLITNINNYFSNVDERNLMVAGIYRSRFNSFRVSFLISNNTINNVGNNYYGYVNSNLIGLNVFTRSIDFIINTSNNSISTEITNGASIMSDVVFNINNFDSSIPELNNSIFFGVNQKPLNILNFNYNNSYYNCFINGFYNINYVPEPEQPSGDNESGDIPSNDTLGNITNTSGDYNGNIDLQPIQQGITDINNNITGSTQNIINTISGDTLKITNSINNLNNSITTVPDISDTTISSGDIVNSLGFTFMADPYDNFWFEVTQGLSACLTGSVRQLPVDWLGYQGYFTLDGLINYPTPLKNILTTISTVVIVWILVKWWKIIIDKLTSGDVDEVLAMNEEERYC